MNKTNGRRQTHHQSTKKYEKQKIRTAKNKARHTAKAKALKKAADERKGFRTLDKETFGD